MASNTTAISSEKFEKLEILWCLVVWLRSNKPNLSRRTEEHTIDSLSEQNACTNTHVHIHSALSTSREFSMEGSECHREKCIPLTKSIHNNSLFALTSARFTLSDRPLMRFNGSSERLLTACTHCYRSSGWRHLLKNKGRNGDVFTAISKYSYFERKRSLAERLWFPLNLKRFFIQQNGILKPISVSDYHTTA